MKQKKGAMHQDRREKIADLMSGGYPALEFGYRESALDGRMLIKSSRPSSLLRPSSLYQEKKSDRAEACLKSNIQRPSSLLRPSSLINEFLNF